MNYSQVFETLNMSIEADMAKVPPKVTRKYYDTNGDGKADVCDETEASGARRRWIDLDHDGKWDVVLEDSNGDGKWEGGKTDSDRDGKFETRWTDRNGDGKVQEGELEEISPPEPVKGPPFP